MTPVPAVYNGMVSKITQNTKGGAQSPAASRDVTLSRWSSLVADYLPTLCVELGVMFSQLWVYRLASHLLGTIGFSEYAVARRTIAFVFPLTLLGLTVSLPRFIARNKHSDSSTDVGYFGAALSLALVTTSTVVALMNVAPGKFAKLFFGSETFTSLIFPVSLLIAGLAFHTVAYAYFRGHLLMRHANVLQFVNLGLIPPLVLLLSRGDVRRALLLLGASTLTVGVVAIVSLGPWQEIIVGAAKIKELLRYGIQRVPGDLALLGLFALPTTITAHARGVREAGLVAFATLAITIVSAGVSPLGLILLPKASRMFASGDFSHLKSHVLQLVLITAFGTGAISVALGIFAKPIVRAYLGSDFLMAADLIRVVAFGIMPYCLFLLLSHVIDAFHKNSITAAIELVAITVAGAGWWIAWTHDRNSFGFVLAFLAGVLVLAGLAITACLTIFRTLSAAASAPEPDICDPVLVQGQAD
jgi:O-antigen/teichoic acid export membrane protein